MRSERAADEDPLLLVLPLAVHQRDGRIYIENQAANGLGLWLRHFSRMTLAVVLYPGEDIPESSVPIDELGLGDRLEVVLMPAVWQPLTFLRAFPAMRRLLNDLIDRHVYLQFAIGGAWGDWGAVGALLAVKRGRKASVWTDRVESEVLWLGAKRAPIFKRPFKLANAWLARVLERRVIRCTALGLFHGKDTFDVYQQFSPNPHLVHDIHLKPVDRIGSERLAAKRAAVSEGPLEIIYVGRLHPDKGVLDWIETLRQVVRAGLSIRARWFGNGPQLDEARAKVEGLGLQSSIAFPGLIADRRALLEELRAAHLMLFCHQTPESPRCLIEALVSGTPIVGYESAYPEDLIAVHGGGVLTAKTPTALAAELIRLSDDRGRIADLIEQAARDGEDMNDEAVFARRSELIKQYS